MKRITLLALLAATTVTAAANSPYIAKVIMFWPAPGQFVNSVPELEPGCTPEEAIAEAERQIAGGDRPGMISLGAFGGYVMFMFDHPVVNVKGEPDFKIYGNAFNAGSRPGEGGSSEPGIVMVCRDDNGNGIPDDEWYELKGSEYANPAAIRDFVITYYRPSQLEAAEPIRWTSNHPDYPSGEIEINEFHTQSYWPGWVGSDVETITFSGTRLPDNATDTNGDGSNWVQKPFEWGYVDNLPDFTRDGNGDYVPDPANPGFDISNAVDAHGNHVELDHIDFIKVYSAINQQCGWTGETSTEIRGGIDLHYKASLDEIKDGTSPVMRLNGRTLSFSAESGGMLRVFDTSGRMTMTATVTTGHNAIDLSRLATGIYIVNAGGRSELIALR